MVLGLPALLATLAALAGTGLLISRAKSTRPPYLVAWCLTLAGISIALGAMAVGFVAGFGGLLFRVMEVGGALLAPVWLALGVIVLISRPVPVRFGAWLFAVSYSIVAVVILLLDPLKGSFDKSLPDPGRNYDALPLLLIDVAHVVAVIALVVGAAVTAMRASKRDREAYALLMPVALVALAGVLAVAGSRGFLPGLVAVAALAGAAGLVWYGAQRTLPAGGPQAEEEYGDEEPYGDEEYREQVYPEQEYQQYQEQGFPEPGFQEPARTGYDDLYADGGPPTQFHPGPDAADGTGGQMMPNQMPNQMPGQMANQMPPVPPANPAPAGMGTGGFPGPEPFAEPAAPAMPAMAGQITVYTLAEGTGEAFDRVAAEVVRAARAAEPDTLIFTCHEVTGAPNQRIVYQLFRDQAGYQEHQRQPHVQRFLVDAQPYVLATNVIELKLGAAKVLPLPSLTAQDYP